LVICNGQFLNILRRAAYFDLFEKKMMIFYILFMYSSNYDFFYVVMGLFSELEK